MRLGRKTTGGKYHRFRKKKHFEKDSQERLVAVRDLDKRKTVRTIGGNKKAVTLSAKSVNISIKGKMQKTTIKKVVETPQNFFLARQNRLMKGVVIETPLGKAKITNRPTQEGMVNAVLVESK
ncbi:MAG: 30S ribosomal protein S8e [Nanoarchaeota archaeon]